MNHLNSFKERLSTDLRVAREEFLDLNIDPEIQQRFNH